MEGLNENAVQRVLGEVGSVKGGEIVKAAQRKRELGVEIKRGGGEATTRGGELGGEKELQGELGFPGATLGDNFSD